MSAVLNKPGLSDQEHTDFITAIKSLLAIETTDQLLQWTKVELQALLPHEIFIFGVRRISKDSIQIGQMFSNGFPAAWLAIFQKHQLRNMAAHGMRDLSSNVASYFNFSRINGRA